MHQKGIGKEHKRPDRDRYIDLHNAFPPDPSNPLTPDICKWRTTAPKAANTKINYFGLPYDYCSVTHAGKYDYHGQPSPSSGQPCWIKTLNEVNCVVNGNHVIQIGQRFGLSDLDKETIRRRYNCRGML